MPKSRRSTLRKTIKEERRARRLKFDPLSPAKQDEDPGIDFSVLKGYTPLMGMEAVKVAIAGTSGLAQLIAEHISSTHHICAFLSRAPKPELTEKGYLVKEVSYQDEKGLINALRGFDMVISMVTEDDQLLLIDAAKQAGIKRFVASEFGGLPKGRSELLDHRHRFALNRLEQHVPFGMQFSYIVCGLFYETFSYNGLAGWRVGGRRGLNFHGDLLMNMHQGIAGLPNDSSGRPAMVCMSLMSDVAAFIADALDKWQSWPKEIRVRSDRLSVEDLVAAAEHTTNLQFQWHWYQYEKLSETLENFEEDDDTSTQSTKTAMLMEIATGRMNFSPAVPEGMQGEIGSMTFHEWLASTFGIV